MKGAGTAKAAGLNHWTIDGSLTLGSPTMSARLLGHPRVVLVKVTENGSPLPKLEIPAICQPSSSFPSKAGDRRSEPLPAPEWQVIDVVQCGEVPPDAIKVAPVETRIPVIHRRQHVDLFAQRMRVLIFELKCESRREPAQNAELPLMRDRVSSGLVVGNRAERLIGPPRLHGTRRRGGIIQVEEPFEVCALVSDIREANGGVRDDLLFQSEIPLLMVWIPAITSRWR